MTTRALGLAAMAVGIVFLTVALFAPGLNEADRGAIFITAAVSCAVGYTLRRLS